MPITVIPTNNFIKDLKRLSKKHRILLSDIADLSAKLKINPTMVLILGKMFIKSVYLFQAPIKVNQEVQELFHV